MDSTVSNTSNDQNIISEKLKKIQSMDSRSALPIDFSWPFPQDLADLNQCLSKVYQGFNSQQIDDFFLQAKKEEQQLNKNQDWQTIGLKSHRRSLVHFARQILQKIPFDHHQSFWLIDLSRIAYKLRQWHHELPFVRPFYAVKCNTNPGVLHVTAALGAGFDCASREELHSVVHTLALAKKHHETLSSGSSSSSSKLGEEFNLRSLPHVNESKRDFKGLKFWKESQNEDGDSSSSNSNESKSEREDQELLFQDAELQEEVSKRIIFTHSIKQLDHIEYARKIGVKMTVADNETELAKLKEFWPDAAIILRVVADDRNSSSSFSTKFGATKKQIRDNLIPLAHRLGLKLVGVSFHAGSLSKDPPAWTKAISDARMIFDWAKEIGGYHMTILDIGGGFPGTAAWDVRFEQFAAEIRSAISQHFPSNEFGGRLQVVGEPGRFVVADSHALVASIIGTRTTEDPDQHDKEDKEEQTEFRSKVMHQLDHFQYYINDGIFAGLNKYSHEKGLPLHVHSLRFSNPSSHEADSAIKDQIAKKKRKREEEGHEQEQDHKKQKQVIDEEAAYQPSEKLFESTIFGQTCDGDDAPAKGALLPRLDVGDAFVFVDTGAYTIASSSHFNGFSDDRIIYVHASDQANTDVLKFHSPSSPSSSSSNVASSSNA